MAQDEYQIEFTDSSNPPVVVLPASRNTETNLAFHGRGLQPYGKSLNENLLHLLENFASPEYAGSPYVPGVPDPAYFDASKAVKGQLWFNTTSGTLMVYNGTNWVATSVSIPASGTAPVAPQNGDLWYDTVDGQLKVFYGTWESVAERYTLKSGDTMTGPLTLSGAPTNPLHAATKQYVDDVSSSLADYVLKAGDTMSGDLNMGSNQINFSGLAVGGFGGNAAAGPDIYSTNADDLSLGAGFNIYAIVDTDNNGTGQFNVRKGNLSSSSSTSLFTVTNAGRIQSDIASYETLVTTNNSIPNKKYVDDAGNLKVNRSGDTMTGRLQTLSLVDTRAAPTISGGTLTINLATANVFEVTRNANISTVSFTNPPASGIACSFIIKFNATGSYSVTWPASVRWSGGTAPTLTATSGKVDTLVFYTTNGGVTYYASVVGLNA